MNKKVMQYCIRFVTGEVCWVLDTDVHQAFKTARGWHSEETGVDQSEALIKLATYVPVTEAAGVFTGDGTSLQAYLPTTRFEV